MTKKKKLNISILSICLSLTCCLTYCLTNYFQAKYTTTSAVVRTIDATPSEIDYQSILDEFEDAKLETIGTLTTFEGTKPISLDDFNELDNLSESDIATCEDISVTYNFSYDSETNIVTVSAETKSGENIIEVEEIQGVAFINDQGEIDAVLNIDGEGLLLSEMQDLGMIQNCGWFKRLFKKVVKVVAVAAAVVAVAAVVVATVGAAAPAVVAAGVGVVAGGTIATSTLATAAIAAGVAVGAALIDKVLESQDGSISFDNSYTIGREENDPRTKDIVSKIFKTATLTTLLNVGREYHITFAVSNSFSENGISYNVGDLYISKLTLSFAEAYLVLIASGMTNSINNLTSSNDIINIVSNTTTTSDMKNLINLIESYKTKGYFSKKVQGIYADSVESAAILATVSGAWIKSSDDTLIGYGGTGGYNHFHDFNRIIHIWYGARK